MAHKIALDHLLELLSINGQDVHAFQRATLIEKTVYETYPGYPQECEQLSPSKLIREARKRWHNVNSLKITHKDGLYEISFHVYGGCSGDWHEKQVYSHFHLFHEIRGYKNHTGQI